MWYLQIAGMFAAGSLFAMACSWFCDEDEWVKYAARATIGAIVWPLTVLAWLVWLALGKPRWWNKR